MALALGTAVIASMNQDNDNDNDNDDDDDRKSLHDYIHALPKVELHAHLHGCIRESTLFALAKERNATLSSHHFAAPTVAIDNTATTETTNSTTNSNDNDDAVVGVHGDLAMYNVLPRSLQDCFDMFAEIPACVNDLPALTRITLEALQDFAEHHVVYLELRSTPKRLLVSHAAENSGIMATKEDYIDTILLVLRDFEALEASRYDRELTLFGSSPSISNTVRLPMVCRFIVAIDRSQTLQEAEENVNLAVAFAKREYCQVVGVDLGGNPTKQDFRDFEPLLRKARNKGLQVTVHCAEVPCGNDNPNESQAVVTAREEAAAILQFRPDRLGHALLLSPSLQAKLDQLRIPVETCPTSNVMTLELAKLAGGNLIHGLQSHPTLHHWLQTNHPLAIGTDDPGVFATTATKELLLTATAYQLSKDALTALVYKSMEYAFCNDLMRARVKERMKQANASMHQLLVVE